MHILRMKLPITNFGFSFSAHQMISLISLISTYPIVVQGQGVSVIPA